MKKQYVMKCGIVTGCGHTRVIANARVREALAALPATPPQAKEAAVAAAGG